MGHTARHTRLQGGMPQFKLHCIDAAAGGSPTLMPLHVSTEGNRDTEYTDINAAYMRQLRI